MDKLGWIWLQDVLGYCTHTVNLIFETVSHPDELIGASESALSSLGIFSPKEIFSIRTTTKDNANQVMEKCEKSGYNIVTPQDEEYGERLRNIPIMPAVLYTEGKFMPMNGTPVIAMVGTREMTCYGSKVAYQLSYDVSKAGFTIVSGLAMGIDSQSHKGALKAGGSTIAVVGAGLDIDYPTSNHELREMIIENGAVVTEYQLGVKPIGYHFPIRNRIISGISDGVVVVEGNHRSGSMITAGHALAQNRDVFAVPNRIYEASSRGCFELIRQGAKPVFSVKDILDEYPIYFEGKMIDDCIDKLFAEDNDSDLIGVAKAKRVKKQKKNNTKEKPKPIKLQPDYLTNEQKMIYAVLKDKQADTQYICDSTGLSITKVLTSLTELEIYGLAKAMPGNIFCLI